MEFHRPTLELWVEETEVDAGDSLTGWVRIVNRSRQLRHYRNLDLRLQTGQVTRRELKDWTEWRIIEDFAVDPNTQLEMPFNVVLPDLLRTGTAELSAVAEPYGFSIVGPPIVLLFIRPSRMFVTLVEVIASVGNAQLPPGLTPWDLAATSLEPRRRISGALFVSEVRVTALETSGNAAGRIIVSRLGNTGKKSAAAQETARIPFSVRLDSPRSMKAQFRKTLAPVWNSASDYPLPATQRIAADDLPVPADPAQPS